MILGGSDAPVELGDPRIEFYAAVARKRLDGTDGPGWHPELAVSREAAEDVCTLWPAYGAFQEDLRGSLEVGKLADFTVFDRDFLTIPEAEILEAETVMTIVGGRVSYEAPRAPWRPGAQGVVLDGLPLRLVELLKPGNLVRRFAARLTLEDRPQGDRAPVGAAPDQ